MEHVLDEMRATFNCGIYYPTAATALMLPDACGAAEFVGQAIKPSDKYKRWYEKWIEPNYCRAGDIKFGATQAYILRNALMHEAATFVRGDVGYDRVVFTLPQHGLDMDFCYAENAAGRVLQLSLGNFLTAIEGGVRNWLNEIRTDTDPSRANAVDKLIQYHPQGVARLIVGVPLIG